MGRGTGVRRGSRADGSEVRVEHARITAAVGLVGDRERHVLGGCHSGRRVRRAPPACSAAVGSYVDVSRSWRAGDTAPDDASLQTLFHGPVSLVARDAAREYLTQVPFLVDGVPTPPRPKALAGPQRVMRMPTVPATPRRSRLPSRVSRPVRPYLRPISCR